MSKSDLRQMIDLASETGVQTEGRFVGMLPRRSASVQ
jgi:hypothetical protein